MSREERTGWRDEFLSRRHRLWGANCPMVDIDLLWLEYDLGAPIAIIEYKHDRASPQDPTHPSYRALKRLADRAALPCFAVRYRDDHDLAFAVRALNRLGLVRTPDGSPGYSAWMSELGYVTWLYQLRRRPMPKMVMDILDQTPWSTWISQARQPRP